MSARRWIVLAGLSFASLALVASAARAGDSRGSAAAPPAPPATPGFATPAAPPPPPPAGAPKATPGTPQAAPGAPAPPSPPPQAPRKPPTSAEKAEDYYKNIQVLKGTPADQLFPAMEFISASLGVDCDFCHVDHKPEADDKEEKMSAREMIKMMNAINRDNFEGHREVTCQTCHHGESHPASTPEVATGKEEPEAPPAAANAERPTVDAVLGKYLTALGGNAALDKITSRQQKGMLTGAGPQPLPVEIFSKAPNKRISQMQTPRGSSSTAFDGTAGWTGGGERSREMSETEMDAFRLDATLQFPAQLKGYFKDMRVARPGRIDGKDAVRVVGRNEGKAPVELWFDAQSGLLLRQVRYVETPLGRNPTQVDYADYRDVDGVKVPHEWSVARPGSRFTIKVSEVKQNLPIDDAKFARPKPAA